MTVMILAGNYPTTQKENDHKSPPWADDTEEALRAQGEATRKKRYLYRDVDSYCGFDLLPSLAFG